jgi:hypothetical protein
VFVLAQDCFGSFVSCGVIQILEFFPKSFKKYYWDFDRVFTESADFFW